MSGPEDKSASLLQREFFPSPRLLLGPGPSLVHPRVLHALSAPLIGHLDPEFLQLLDETQAALRQIFGTTNSFTMALSGTGSAGMEGVMVNLLEPGDTAVVGVNGVFGSRLATIAERGGAKVIRVEAPWGRTIDVETIRSTVRRSGPVKLVAIVHAETSTGACQSLSEIGRLCHETDTLFVVDAVTSLGGIPVQVDAWHIDACYSATQKCLSCPPGLAPVTLSPRALAAMRRRRVPCPSWYLDFSLLADYWDESTRRYHHTAPISMIYALREALRLVLEEGLENRFARHRRHGRALVAGMATLGLTPLPLENERLPMLHCLTLPTGIDDQQVRAELLRSHGIEIGGGLGPLQGSVWRIGLMGESSTASNVLSLLQALELIWLRRGWRCPAPGAALAAAASVLDEGPTIHSERSTP
ncbi:alanine--glyoxylate aminotransferase [Nitrospira sp.]|nr:alanine--glyoxylate aminotransferase [Nitrospira sp.]